jgi:hypothetical protein
MSDRKIPRDESGHARRDGDGAAPPRPPGDFLTEDLASATARFLEEVKERIHRTAEHERRPRGPRL